MMCVTHRIPSGYSSQSNAAMPDFCCPLRGPSDCNYNADQNAPLKTVQSVDSSLGVGQPLANGSCAAAYNTLNEFSVLLVHSLSVLCTFSCSYSAVYTLCYIVAHTSQMQINHSRLSHKPANDGAHTGCSMPPTQKAFLVDKSLWRYETGSMAGGTHHLGAKNGRSHGVGFNAPLHDTQRTALYCTSIKPASKHNTNKHGTTTTAARYAIPYFRSVFGRCRGVRCKHLGSRHGMRCERWLKAAQQALCSAGQAPRMTYPTHCTQLLSKDAPASGTRHVANGHWPAHMGTPNCPPKENNKKNHQNICMLPNHFTSDH